MVAPSPSFSRSPSRAGDWASSRAGWLLVLIWITYPTLGDCHGVILVLNPETTFPTFFQDWGLWGRTSPSSDQYHVTSFFLKAWYNMFPIFYQTWGLRGTTSPSGDLVLTFLFTGYTSSRFLPPTNIPEEWPFSFLVIHTSRKQYGVLHATVGPRHQTGSLFLSFFEH